MAMTRRDVLKKVAAAGALVAGTDPAWAAQRAVPTGGWPPPGFAPVFASTRDEFAQYVKQAFQVLGPDRRVHELTLAAVQDGAAARLSGTIGSQHCFTAVFAGPAWFRLPEGTYDGLSPDGMPLTLYFKPGSTAGEWQLYEVPFNRVPPQFIDRAFG